MARLGKEPCRGGRCATGSACVMQRAELFNQQLAGDQFQLEIKRALHENLYGFLRGHGILLPWAWWVASSAVSFTYLIGGFAGKLDCGKTKGREGLGRGKMAVPMAA